MNRRQDDSPILHIKLWQPVLVHEAGQHGKGGAGLCHDGDGHGIANPVLPLLHHAVVGEGDEKVIVEGNISNIVESGSPDGFLVSFQQLQKLRTDSPPLSGTQVLRTKGGEDFSN